MSNNNNKRPTRAEQQKKTNEINVKPQPNKKPVPTPQASEPKVEEVKTTQTATESPEVTSLDNALKEGKINKELHATLLKAIDSAENKPQAKDYTSTIIALMEAYEEAFPIRKIMERGESERMQRRLWSIVFTAITQPDYAMFKIGWRTILARMSQKEHYNTAYLFRALANPSDPQPVLESYTIALYNFMLIVATHGAEKATSRVSLEDILTEMPYAAQVNLSQYHNS